MIVDISDKTLYNELYLPAIFNDYRYLILYGGRDSAKSHSVAQRIVYKLLQPKYAKIVCVRKTYASIPDSQIALIWKVIKQWGLESLFTKTKSPHNIICNKTGNEVICRGLDDVEKLKSLTDPTLIWAEEADQITYDDYVILDTSIRCSDNSIPLQLILTFNPISEHLWMNQEFFPPRNTYERDDGKWSTVPSIKDDTYILHTCFWDNRWCPGERSRIYLNLPEDKRKVLCYGLWGGDLKGRIYNNFSYQDIMPTIENRKFSSIALDWGFTNDPTAIIDCCIGPQGKIYVEELVYERGLANRKSENMPSVEEQLELNGVMKQELILADSAEPKSIAEVRSCGYNIVGVKKPPGSRAFGIQLLQQYEIVICGRSPNLKREIQSYKWAEDKHGNLLNVPNDGDDHCMDALRYWALKHLSLKDTGKNKHGNIYGL